MNDEQKPQAAEPAEKKTAEVKAVKADLPPVEPGLVAKRLAALGHSVESLAPDAQGTETLRLTSQTILAVAAVLRDDSELAFDFLMSVTGVDWKTHRESVYHLYSTATSQWLSLKIQADAQDHSPSLMPVWPAADWHEREAYDLMGIVYDGHPDLRRILMPTYWLGYPLRKGYKEEDPRLVWNRR